MEIFSIVSWQKLIRYLYPAVDVVDVEACWVSQQRNMTLHRVSRIKIGSLLIDPVHGLGHL